MPPSDYRPTLFPPFPTTPATPSRLYGHHRAGPAALPAPSFPFHHMDSLEQPGLDHHRLPLATACDGTGHPLAAPVGGPGIPLAAAVGGPGIPLAAAGRPGLYARLPHLPMPPPG